MSKKKELRHPWLDETDPANTKRLFRKGLPGFWVPTPGEIEYGCELAREEIIKAMKCKVWGSLDERSKRRLPKEVTVYEQRREIGEDSQLCDCPYWGTEFKDC